MSYTDVMRLAAQTEGGAISDFLASPSTANLNAALGDAVIATPVAAAGAGGGVATAAQLGTATIVSVSSDGATKGVKLPTSLGGEIVYIINTSATACNFFAASGGTINAASADVGKTIPASKGALCLCTAADTWYAFDLTAHVGASA